MILREKVIKALEAGQNTKDVSVRFDVGISWVYKIYRKYRNTGSYKVLPRPDTNSKLQNDDITKLKQLFENNPPATLEELKQMSALAVGRTTIYKNLREKLKITCKKLFLQLNKTVKTLNKLVRAGQ